MDIRKMLEEKGKCCSGCGACLNSCAAGALTMQPDGRGFYYPSVQEALCVSCGRCTAVCPKLNPPETGTDEPACYALWAEDEIRDALRIYQSDDATSLLRQLRKCRCSRMEELHESQRRVDRLDYLIRQTQKNNLIGG